MSVVTSSSSSSSDIMKKSLIQCIAARLDGGNEAITMKEII
jgi:hypothetical protein